MTCLYPQESVEKWIKRWNLELDQETCEDCKHRFIWVRPYYSNRTVGVESDMCPCGFTCCSGIIHKKELREILTSFSKS